MTAETARRATPEATTWVEPHGKQGGRTGKRAWGGLQIPTEVPSYYTIIIMNYNSENNYPKRISWVSIVNAIVQAVIAALTALGVSSCANLL